MVADFRFCASHRREFALGSCCISQREIVIRQPDSHFRVRGAGGLGAIQVGLGELIVMQRPENIRSGQVLGAGRGRRISGRAFHLRKRNLSLSIV